jgi:hypothetical protein
MTGEIGRAASVVISRFARWHNGAMTIGVIFVFYGEHEGGGEIPEGGADPQADDYGSDVHGISSRDYRFRLDMNP